MSEPENQKQGDKLLLKGHVEQVEINTPDANAARVAGASDIKAFQDTNLNKHSGSAGGADQESIQIVALDKNGKEEIIAERAKENKANPVAQMIAQFSDWVESLADGQDKERFREEVRAQSSDAGIAKISEPTQPLENTPDGWLEVGHRIAALHLDKQIQVIGNCLVIGVQDYQAEQRQRTLGALIGTVQGVGHVAENLAKIADFGAALILNDKDKAGALAAEFGTSVGQTIVGGVQLFQAVEKYSYDIGYTGDYGKPLRDIQFVANTLNDKWSKLSPLEQERVKYEFISEMVAGGLTSGGGAAAIGKAKKYTEILEVIADKSKQFAIENGGKAWHGSKKMAEKIAVSVKRLAEPELVSAEGQIVKVSDFVKKPGLEIKAADLVLEKRRFGSMYDPNHRLTPIEAARQNAKIKHVEFDEKEWKKLTAEEKAERLIKEGYKEILEYGRHVDVKVIEDELKLLKQLPVKPLDHEIVQPQIDRIRKAINAKPRENVAIGLMDIDGNVESMVSLNGLTSPDGTIFRLKPGEKQFSVLKKYGGAIDHADDSEVKILEHLATKLDNSTFKKAKLYIYTERPACPSCELVKAQFEEKFKGRITVEFTNNPAMEK